MKNGLLIVMSGPSGVGKGTLREKIFEDKELNLAFSISMTTRAPRGQEQDGIDYFFVDTETFERYIQEGRLLEFAKFVGNYYGTSKDYVDKLLSEGKNVFIEIEVDGARQLMDKVRGPHAFSIFVLPPSIEELENRIRGRKTESEEKIQQRLARAHMELSRQNEYDYKIVNDDLNRAAEELKNIIRSRMNA